MEDRSLLSAAPLAAVLPPSNPAPALHGPVAPPATTAAAASQLKLYVPATVAVGTPVNVVVNALTSTGKPALGYTGLLTVSSTPTGVTLPTNNGKIAFYGGVAMFQVTFPTAETGTTLTVTDNSTSPLTATSSAITAIDPTAVTQYAVYVPRDVLLNTATEVRVVAENGFGRPVSAVNGTTSAVTLTSSDNLATLPTSSLNFINGVATASVTFGTAGANTTLTATDANGLTGSATTTVVDPTVATSFVVLTPHKVATGTSFNVTVIALNALHKPVSGYTGPVTVTTSDTATGVVLPSTITWSNGEATFAVTLITPSTSTTPTTLTVADNSSPTPIAALTKTVDIVVVDPTVVTGFKVTLPPVVQKGEALTVQVEAVNGLGQAVTDYTGPITLLSSDTLAVLPSTTALEALTWTDGVASFPVIFESTGPQTLTVTDANSTASHKAATFVVGTSVGRGAVGIPSSKI